MSIEGKIEIHLKITVNSDDIEEQNRPIISVRSIASLYSTIQLVIGKCIATIYLIGLTISDIF